MNQLALVQKGGRRAEGGAATTQFSYPLKKSHLQIKHQGAQVLIHDLAQTLLCLFGVDRLALLHLSNHSFIHKMMVQGQCPTLSTCLITVGRNVSNNNSHKNE